MFGVGVGGSYSIGEQVLQPLFCQTRRAPARLSPPRSTGTHDGVGGEAESSLDSLLSQRPRTATNIVYIYIYILFICLFAYLFICLYVYTYMY